MNGKSVWVIGWVVLFSFVAAPIEAVTWTYEAVVTSSSGPNSTVFSPGEPVIISYTLNTLIVDINSNSQMGLFPISVMSLSVSFPKLGVFATAGPSGTAQTFNNVVDQVSGKVSDQVFFFGGPISSSSLLGGKPISFLEVDFLSDFVAPPAEPSMLSSDALPLSTLPIIDAFLFLGTSSGFTSVHFAAAPVTPHDDPDPPAVPGLTSPSLPGFRFWVRIGDSRIGAIADTPCPGETVCVRGALASRAEVFVRIVGPKGNGYLWPNIVKFNTTKTEVWIQQISTGTTKYYLLPSLPQDSDSLLGLVDKTGFLP